jgi:hypothetical protein
MDDEEALRFASIFVVALPQLQQELADAARRSQFERDVRGKAQIAIGIEPAGLGVGRQFAHRLSKSEKDLLDLTRIETPFSGHARHLSSRCH